MSSLAKYVFRAIRAETNRRVAGENAFRSPKPDNQTSRLSFCDGRIEIFFRRSVIAKCAK